MNLHWELRSNSFAKPQSVCRTCWIVDLLKAGGIGAVVQRKLWAGFSALLGELLLYA
jgi:hypothetical protein